MLDKFRPKTTIKPAHTGGKSLLTNKLVLNKRNGLIFIAMFAVVGASLLVISRAATSFMAFEPETGTLAAGATSVANANASGGRVLAFGGAATPAPTPAPTGKVYYISPSGSDTNSGTSTSSPWRTLGKVNSTVLNPGEAVLFQGGQTFSGVLTPRGSGNSSNSTLYSSYGTGKATITGNKPMQLTAIHHVTISNLIIDGAGSTCVSDTASGAGNQYVIWDSLEVRNCYIGFQMINLGDAYNTIMSSYIHDTVESGLILVGQSGGAGHLTLGPGWVVKDNSIQRVGKADDGGCGVPGLGYGAHGIYLQTMQPKILRNDIGFYSCEGGQAVSNRSPGALIEGNYLHDGPTGISYFNYSASTGAGQYTTIVRYNRFYNMCRPVAPCASGYGISVSAEANAGSRPNPDNWIIHNNTFMSPNARGIAIAYRGGVATMLAIQNNVFAGSWGFGQLEVTSPPANYTEDYNDFSATNGGGHGAHDITANPLLSSAPVLSLGAGSPAIDRGTTSVSVTTFSPACDGAPLHYCGSAPDMGAVEH